MIPYSPNDWPQTGDKVKFLTAEGMLYPFFTNIIDFAKKNLISGREYTVKKCEVYSSWCGIWLEEVEFEHPFHKSMFEWTPSEESKNVDFRGESIRLKNKLTKVDSISEFGAEALSVTSHPVIGLQRWTDKQFMLSFFPTKINGERLQYQSKIDKVYDLFLTEEQMESIVREYNNQRTYDPFTNHANH